MGKENRNILGKTLVFVAICFSMIMVRFILYNRIPTSDNYFMLAHANVIKNYGFVTEDVLRMHEGLNSVIPQWLFAVCYSFFINTFGVALGYKIAGFIMYFIFISSFILFMIHFGKKSSTSIIYSIIILSIILMRNDAIRPFYITVSILMIEAVLLDKYFCSLNKKYLIGIPILSILLINIHNSLWIGLFLVLACFIFESFINSIRIKKLDNRLIPLVVVGIVSIFCGLINPYGFEYMIYIFKSMGSIKPLEGIIGEIQPLYDHIGSIDWYLALGSIIILAVILIYKCKKKELPNIRLLVMFSGFLFMYIIYARNGILFYSVAQAFMLDVLSPIEIRALDFKKAMVVFIVFILVLLSSFGLKEVDFYSGLDMYKMIDSIENYKGNRSASDITVYPLELDAGSYATMLGYRAYIDGCAEMWGIRNNGKRDIASEYVESIENPNKMADLAKEYEFDFIVYYKEIPELKEMGYELLNEVKSENIDYYLYGNKEGV